MPKLALKKQLSKKVVAKPNKSLLKNTVKKARQKKTTKFIDNAIECRVCCDEFESDNEKEPLSCGHVFHYDCIIMSFQCPDLIRSCPYCRKHNGYLRLLNGMIPIKGIHKEYKEYYEKEQKNKAISKCNALYKSGLQKGLPCINKAKDNSLYCGVHKNYSM